MKYVYNLYMYPPRAGFYLPSELCKLPIMTQAATLEEKGSGEMNMVF